MFEWAPVGEVSIPPSVTVGQGRDGELILDHINIRGFPDRNGIGVEMVKQAAHGINLPQPSKISASNVINEATKKAIAEGTPVDQTAMAGFLRKTAEALGGTPSNFRHGEKARNIWMEVDVTY